MPAASRSRLTFCPAKRRTSFDMGVIGQGVELIAKHYDDARYTRGALGPRALKIEATTDRRRPGKARAGGRAFTVKIQALTEMGDFHRDHRRADRAKRRCFELNQARHRDWRPHPNHDEAESCVCAMDKKRRQGSRLGRNKIRSTYYSRAAVERGGSDRSCNQGLFYKMGSESEERPGQSQCDGRGVRHWHKIHSENPAEAMRWYRAAVGGGDPAKANGPLYAKLRIAEMYEDGEGVARDLDEAGRIYKTIPDFPSAMLHFAIAYVEGRRVPQDYVEAYKLLLLANKFRSMNPPTRKLVETDPQRHRENRRHIRVRELMAVLESRMAPEHLLRATEAAREWWNAH